MRKLSEITANIVPISTGQRTFGRRPLSSVVGHLTCLVLFKHAEQDAMIHVSDDGDAVGAIWLPKAMMDIDRTDRGPFLVVKISATFARSKGLSVCLLDWDRYTPSERVMLKDAVEAARRTRERLSGQSGNRPTWSGGRNVYA